MTNVLLDEFGDPLLAGGYQQTGSAVPSTSRTYVINRALIRLGAATITAPTDNNEQARKAGMVFNGLARAELRRQAWSFSIKRAVLAILGTAPLFGFRSAYNLPGDCLRVVEVDGNWCFDVLRELTLANDAYYAIEGRKLVSLSSGPAQLRYISDVTLSPDLWDAAFEDAFVYRLAAEITPTLKQNIQLRREILNDYKVAISEAKRTNAIELPPEDISDGSWVATRYTY